jgi:histidinol dehydrogenase
MPSLIPQPFHDSDGAMLATLDLRGIDLSPDPARHLPRPVIAGDEPRQAVRDIIARVRRDGDGALIELTARYDGVELDAVPVAEADIDRAVETMSPDLRSALDEAIEAIDIFHRHQLRPPETLERHGITINAFQRPVRRAGLYVPGGRAEYPSTVLMTAVPARVAGVGSLALCVPPSAAHDGNVAPSVLAAAKLSGVDEIFAVGGAQAIAAMAYGTESVAPVDVIAGPGNVYVAIAKQEVASDVGVAAAFAGPSEVVVVADGSADPRYVALDLIVQAEHGPDGLAWLVTWDEDVAAAVCAVGTELVDASPRAEEVRATLTDGGYVALVDGPEQALSVVDAIAPEHLELQCSEAETLAGHVNNAGAIFCGRFSPAALGDYIAGPSHVLPTHGSARFASALTVGDFLKDHHVVTASAEGLRAVGHHVVALADQEGLQAHADCVRIRLEDLDDG